MSEIKCPHCGNTFSLDNIEYLNIVNQVRNQEFNKELKEREEIFNKEKDNLLLIERKKVEDELNKVINNQSNELIKLNNQLDNLNKDNELKVKDLINQKDMEILKLHNKIDNVNKENELKEKNLINLYENKIKEKDQEVNYYKDLKTKLSTKLVGESLEQHCLIEFNKIRMSAYPNATFEKDNEVKEGSKGDFIFREDLDGEELISIMFEMKNENDTTSTKHKNEDFFKELDKDRKLKSCEYAVLVSLLESDNEYYNAGIVDVSYKYPKMYVVRPQCFLSIISLLRNASLKSLDYKKELTVIKNQNIDITNFENNLLDFRDKFGKNYESAKNKFDTAISEIDKTIDHLQKVKDNLLSSSNQLRLANNKVEDLTIKKLTRNNPTMKEMFDNLEDNHE